MCCRSGWAWCSRAQYSRRGNRQPAAQAAGSDNASTTAEANARPWRPADVCAVVHSITAPYAAGLQIPSLRRPNHPPCAAAQSRGPSQDACVPRHHPSTWSLRRTRCAGRPVVVGWRWGGQAVVCSEALGSHWAKGLAGCQVQLSSHTVTNTEGQLKRQSRCRSEQGQGTAERSRCGSSSVN